MIRKLAIFLLGIWLSGMAFAVTTYTYVGPNFSLFSSPSSYSASNSITGSFTTASPLTTNLSLTDIGPSPGGANLVTSWSFSDGINTYTNSNSIPFGYLLGNFRVQTDSFGNINGFWIELAGPLTPAIVGTSMHLISLISSPAQSQALAAALCTTVVSSTCTAVAPALDYGDATSGGAFNLNFPTASAPTVAKAFGTSNLALNGSTSLTFTISNPNASTALTGVGIIDPLPAGLVVSNPTGAASTCGTFTPTAGDISVSLTGGTVAANSSCTFSVNVTGTTPGLKNNTTGAISSTEGGVGLTAVASITVNAASPPTIAKAFGTSNLPLNGSTSLTFTITNPNAFTALSGVAVSDPLPAGLVVSNPLAGVTDTCGGTFAPTAGSGSVSLTGGAIAANSSCTFSVNVTGTTSGLKNNTTGNVASNEGGEGLTANASLTVAQAVVATSIPTLSEWGMIILSALMALAAFIGLRRRGV